MKKLVITFTIFLLAAGFAHAKDYEVEKAAGEYTVIVKIDKNPPIAGKNNMTIGIKDGKGNEVTQADVGVEYTMPAMPGMPPMNYKAKTQLIKNAYRATLDLSMPGSWTVQIKITQAGKTESVKLNVDAR